MHVRARRFVILAIVGVVAIIPVVSAAGSGGPAAQMPGAEPGTEKARLIDQAQVEYEAGLAATMAPAVGRPQEQWNPTIIEGISDTIESPFEGSSFVLSNMWQSALTKGRVTRVYVGTDKGKSLVVVTRHELQTGIEEMRHDFALPSGVGKPRLNAAAAGILGITTASGKIFSFDVGKEALVASN